MTIRETSTLQLPSAHASEIMASLSLRGGAWRTVGVALYNQRLALDAATLGELLDTVFFASLTTEEGRRASFSVSLIPPGGGVFHEAHEFKKAEPFSVEAIRKLSAACDGDGTRILVWLERGRWFIWGLAVNPSPPRRSAKIFPGDSFVVVTARDAGVLRLRLEHLVVFTYAGGAGAVARSDEWIAERVAALLPSQDPLALAIHHLSSIYVAMRAHGRGGTLLVVPERSPVTIDFRYPARRSFPGPLIGGGTLHEGPLPHAAALEELVRRDKPESDDPEDDFSFQRKHEYAVSRTDAAAAMIGGMTAVDGVVVMNHAMCVLGFGGKIAVPKDSGEEPLNNIDAATTESNATTIGAAFSGMRHKSAAVACKQAERGSFALVQSQDGALTVLLHTAEGELQAIRPVYRLVPFLER
jgi:hypothetical protein